MCPYIDCHELGKLVGMDFFSFVWLGVVRRAPNYTAVRFRFIKCALDSSSEGQIQQDALLSMVNINTPWVYVQTLACHFHRRQATL